MVLVQVILFSNLLPSKVSPIPQSPFIKSEKSERASEREHVFYILNAGYCSCAGDGSHEKL